MSLFNETLLWFMKRRMPRIEAMYDRPLELQEQMLQGLLSHGRSTEWGSHFDIRRDFSVHRSDDARGAECPVGHAD
jgi:hypothetical protein